MLNPRFPAPVNTYNPTIHALVDAIYDALARIVPDSIRADGRGLRRSIIIGGRTTTTRAKATCNTRSSAAAPARVPSKDGMSGTCMNQSNAKIAPGRDHRERVSDAPPFGMN